MTLTYDEACDDILGMFSTAWGTEVVIYENKPGEIPADGSPWARPIIRHETSSQRTLADINGKKRFSREGTFTAQLFIQSGKGLSSANNYAKIIADAFEGKASPNGVWFTNVRIREVGEDGNYFHINVLADFNYDEIK